MRMQGGSALLHAYFFFLPAFCVWFRVHPLACLGLALLGLFSRWILTLRRLLEKKEVGESVDLVLETIAASHFVEKVRWCMDRAGIEYQEEVDIGILGVFLLGRSVPRLHDRSSANATISNSSNILRYIYGRFVGCPDNMGKVDFLVPTPEILQLEARMDRYGHNIQHALYYHFLKPDVNETCRLGVWGAGDHRAPMWQRLMLKPLLPVLTGFIKQLFKPSLFNENLVACEVFLAEMESLLQDGRTSIMGGKDFNLVDFTFAALSAPWVHPENFGGLKDSLFKDQSILPASMVEQCQRWKDTYPKVTEFVESLYSKERIPKKSL